MCTGFFPGKHSPLSLSFCVSVCVAPSIARRRRRRYRIVLDVGESTREESNVVRTSAEKDATSFSPVKKEFKQRALSQTGTLCELLKFLCNFFLHHPDSFLEDKEDCCIIIVMANAMSAREEEVLATANELFKAGGYQKVFQYIKVSTTSTSSPEFFVSSSGFPGCKRKRERERKRNSFSPGPIFCSKEEEEEAKAVLEVERR